MSIDDGFDGDDGALGAGFRATDRDGDGYFETVPMDTDRDGYAETIAVDRDRDGYAETLHIDRNLDGVTEEVQVDTDLDGRTDAGTIDTNHDGIAERNLVDADRDGVLEDAVAPAPAPSPAPAPVPQPGGTTDDLVQWLNHPNVKNNPELKELIKDISMFNYRSGMYFLQSSDRDGAPGDAAAPDDGTP